MIRIPIASAGDAAVWRLLIDLARRQRGWTLVGARMVELHAFEHGRMPLRLSRDADALADARQRPNPVRRLAELLVSAGFEVEPEGFGHGHAFRKGTLEIDVLAPEELGPRSRQLRTTIPPLHTVSIPGGRQALARSRPVEVEIDATKGTIPRPELVGAILLKARAVEVDDAPTSQRSDLALLLSLVDEPDEARALISPTERRWLRRRSEMDDLDAECWRSLPPDDAQRGLSSLRALTSFK